MRKQVINYNKSAISHVLSILALILKKIRKLFLTDITGELKKWMALRNSKVSVSENVQTEAQKPLGKDDREEFKKASSGNWPV